MKKFLALFYCFISITLSASAGNLLGLLTDRIIVKNQTIISTKTV